MGSLKTLVFSAALAAVPTAFYCVLQGALGGVAGVYVANVLGIVVCSVVSLHVVGKMSRKEFQETAETLAREAEVEGGDHV
jgi:uncharacterized membrane protein YdjX (TVP38/TMEM64 family)